MRVVLADLKGEKGHVNKDTVAGGYGSRFHGRSKAMKIIAAIRRSYENLPSIHLSYIAAILSQAGHEVSITRGRLIPGDLAIILTSLVDFRHEIAWAKQFKQTFGSPAGFFGTPATHVPNLFSADGDFVIRGEAEDAAQRIANGENMKGIVMSKTVQNLDSLPFPRWDLARRKGLSHAVNMSSWRKESVFPLLSSRSCPEFCTYCPHRITAEYRTRSPENVLAELEYIHSNFGKANIVFRDPLFTEERERSLAIAEGIIQRRLPIHFECETRLDALDTNLIDLLHRAGLRSITFGVESVDPETLKRVGRRPIPSDHQKKIISHCRNKGIGTVGFYVFGFLSDTVPSIRATIDYSIQLNSTHALFKILTPYPGTPLRKQMERLIFEQDLEKFDGYTPTFHHPNLTSEDLLFSLSSAFARFYFRPSWPLNFFRIDKYFRRWIESWDNFAQRKHDRSETNRGFVSV